MTSKSGRSRARSLLSAAPAILSLGTLVLSGLTASGCVPTQVRDMFGGVQARTSELNVTLAKFHKQIYWGETELAALTVAPEYRSKFVADSLVKQRGIKMVDADIGHIDIDAGAKHATVEVTFRFYRSPNFVVEKQTDREKWRYSTLENQWYLEGSEQLGETMPNSNDQFIVGPSK